MSAGTGDGDIKNAKSNICMAIGMIEGTKGTATAQAVGLLNGALNALTGNKPQPQVAPTGDFSTCLFNIEKSLSGLADIAESRSITLGDKYGKLADGCIDAMENVQVLRNQANGIEMDEDEAI
jgi:hypothetical protein